MMLADENIHQSIIATLRHSGIEVYSIYESCRGIPDYQVIELAKSFNYSILTEDKDFGEWVFAHHVKNCSVILLRYTFADTENIATILCSYLQKNTLSHPVFITLTPKKIRIRQL